MARHYHRCARCYAAEEALPERCPNYETDREDSWWEDQQTSVDLPPRPDSGTSKQSAPALSLGAVAAGVRSRGLGSAAKPNQLIQYRANHTTPPRKRVEQGTT
jgi:hypothetical protein